MSNRQQILELIRIQPGLTDAQIRRKTGVEPHQQVNQICRALERDGLIRRVPGGDGFIVNVPANGSHSASAVTTERESPPGHRRAVGEPSRSGAIAPLDPAQTLWVLPCSGRKRHVSSGVRTSPILDDLPGALATELVDARRRNASAVDLDERSIGPALEVYDGTLYQEGRAAIGRLLDTGSGVVIISGGYGLVGARDAIGHYDHVFKPGMWPRQLVPRCLAAVAERRGVSTVVGLLAGSTGYATVFRGVDWGPGVRTVLLATPHRVAGAMVKAPRAQGEALRELAESGQLAEGWRSADGVEFEVTVVRG